MVLQAEKAHSHFSHCVHALTQVSSTRNHTTICFCIFYVHFMHPEHERRIRQLL